MSPRYLRSGVSGAVAFVLANIVSNVLFFQLSRDLLFNPQWQSAKVIDVLFEMEPLPLMFTNGIAYMAIAAAIGVVHGLVFAWIQPALPQRSRLARGAAFAVVLWALMALYFEFHTPFNMFREPAPLVLMELGLWAIVLLVEGIILSFLYGQSTASGATETAEK